MRFWRRSKITPVKGGDLKVGDQVVILCEVVEIDYWKHPIVLPVKDTHWNVGDQHLWTWGGEHGAGTTVGPTILKVNRG